MLHMTRLSGNALALPGAGPERLLDAAHARHLQRHLAQAAEYGAALLASLGLPRLVTSDFAPLDRATIGDAVDAAVAALDAMDGDTDLEDGADDEFTGDDELSLGWTAKVAQVHLGQDQDDHEVTALERHGRGFFRSGPDDAEDDELDDDRDPEPVAWVFGPSRREVAHV